MNAVWSERRADRALQLEKKNISKHSCYYVSSIVYCVRCWNVLIYKAVNTWK